jgi:hypothetical protein
MIEKIFRFFFPVVTYEWCVVGSTIGRHSWWKEKRKCKNGTPVGTGYFLTIVHCEDETDADELLKEFNKIALKHNEEKYG